VNEIVEIIEIGTILEIVDGVGPRGPAGIQGEAGGKYVITPQQFIINEEIKSQKKITLSEVPAIDYFFFKPQGGPPQTLGVSYEYDRINNKIIFSPHLGELLEVGDRIEVSYYTTTTTTEG